MDDPTLVGELLDAEPAVQYCYNGEKFYTVPMDFNGTRMNVLYSEYTPIPTGEKLLRVSGILASECTRGSVPKFYFYANSFETVTQNTPQSNQWTIFGHVNRVNKLKATKSNRDYLPVTLTTRWIFGGHSLIYLILHDKLARKYAGLEKGTPVTATGKLESYRDIIEIAVEDLIVKG